MLNPAAARALQALASVAAAALVHTVAPPPDALRWALAILVLAGGLWLTQALPLAVTALLVPLVAVLSGSMTARQALSAFADPVIFLFLGGFALAAALQQQGLDRALALQVMRWAGGQRLRAALMLFAITALLSMWISNTATAAMMLPLALGLLRDGSAPVGSATAGASSPQPAAVDGMTPAQGLGPRERSFVLLGLAYSASIGGMGTLVGSPPNAIAAASAGLGFADWLRVGLPMVLLLMPVMVGVLALVLRPQWGPARRCDGDALREAAGTSDPSARDEPWHWSRPRMACVVVFVLTASAWIASAPLGRWLGVDADLDSVIALAAIAALVATGALSWPQLERQTSWGVLLLFGGGLALSQLMGTSGASRFLGEALAGWLQGAPLALVVLSVAAFVVFLSELVSNTACAAVLVPVFAGVGAAMGLSAPLMACAVGLAASCAFMLPVGTPPNAMVYATEAVPASLMRRCGWWLNLASIGVIALVVIVVFG